MLFRCLFDLGQPMQACTLQQALESVSSRPVDSFPRATQDGAGDVQLPGLVGAAFGARTSSSHCRQQLHAFFMQCKAPSRLRQAVAEHAHRFICGQPSAIETLARLAALQA